MKELGRLEDTVDQFCQLIITLPKSALEEQAWGPKEVLAHLVYYHEQYVAIIEASMSGKAIEPPEGRYCDLNAIAVGESRGVNSKELADRLQKANQRLVQLYKLEGSSEIKVEIKAGAKRRTFTELLIEVEAHIRNHMERLRKEMKIVTTSVGKSRPTPRQP